MKCADQRVSCVVEGVMAVCDNYLTPWCTSSLYNHAHTVPSVPLNTLAVAKSDRNGNSEVTVIWHPPSEEFTLVVSYFLELIYMDWTKEQHPIEAISVVVPRVSA